MSPLSTSQSSWTQSCSHPRFSLRGGRPALIGFDFHQESRLSMGWGPKAQRTDTRNRCQLLPTPGGRGPELPDREESGRKKVSKATTSTNKQHQAHGEELLERAKLHHRANGASREKQRNDYILVWSPQYQLAPGRFSPSLGFLNCQPVHLQNLLPTPYTAL